MTTADIDTEASAATEDDIGLASVVSAIVAAISPDDQIVDAIAIDVAGVGDAAPGLIVCRIALDDEAVAGRQGGQIDYLPSADIDAEASGATEDNIGLACVDAAIVATARADDQIVDAITVDVTRVGDAAPRLIVRRIPLNDEAIAGGKVGEIDDLCWHAGLPPKRPADAADSRCWADGYCCLNHFTIVTITS